MRRPPLRHRTILLGALAAPLAAGVLIAAEAVPGDDVASPLDFPGEPPDALVHRLERSSGLEAPGRPGLVVSRPARRIAAPAAVRIDPVVENRGASPCALDLLGILRWRFGPPRTDEARYEELTYREDLWYGSTYWTGPEWTRVGRDWHHPGERTASVRRFTAPSDGRIVVRGRVFKAHLDGDGIRAEIRHGDRTVWSAEIEGRDAEGAGHEVSLDVRRGDAVRFVVGRLGTIVCDTTRWDPAIEYEGGPSFRASEGFSSEEGAGPWSYELDPEAGAPSSGPRLLCFDGSWTVRETELPAPGAAALTPEEFAASLGPGASTDVFPARGSLELRFIMDLPPLLLVADEEDASGIVLAGGPGARWGLSSSVDPGGGFEVEILVLQDREVRDLPARETRTLPPIVAAPYRGSVLDGLAALQRLIEAPALDDVLGDLREALRRAVVPELPLWRMVQDDWRREDGIEDSDLGAVADAIVRLETDTWGLLGRLGAENPGLPLDRESDELSRILSARLSIHGLRDDVRGLWTRLRLLRRRLALRDPLLGPGEILFAKRAPTSYSHLVMQYFGWRARAGGGLFVLERPGRSLACRDILDGRLESGNVLEPRLSWDGKRVVFSWVEVAGRTWDPGEVSNEDPPTEGFYHIHETGVDGTGFRQLTDGPFDDLMPTYLPGGDIVFVSTRRKGYARCFGAQFSRRWHVYTLHRMDRDGNGIRPISFHDTNEWFPAVLNDGRIVYARWDYIDRDAVTHQNLWAARPDGSNPVALWGNAAPSPHCAFQAKPIPGSHKIVFTASAHHSTTGGPLVVVDPSVDPNDEAALERIPFRSFPEAESRDVREYHEAPWPLSESLFLAAWSPEPIAWEPAENPRNALGLYLVDDWGRRELLYRDPRISSTNPCPLRPRPEPPVLPSSLEPGARPVGELIVADVHEGLGPELRGTVRALRIVQIFPKTTPIANQPPIGVAGEENGRAILGTVPVEADGSARFLVPAGKPLLFQALDADGLAVRTMRSVTYAQPCETISCVGCHERPTTCPPAGRARDLLALRRAPSAIDPGDLGGRPFSYVEVVQPILDRRCVRCHGGEETEAGLDLRGEAQGAYTRSYVALCADPVVRPGQAGPAEPLVPRFAARNQVQITPPGGAVGARGSRLLRMLRDGHAEVELDGDELRRLAAWIDLNAIFYGVNLPEDQARQRRGEPVPMPEIQ